MVAARVGGTFVTSTVGVNASVNASFSLKNICVGKASANGLVNASPHLLYILYGGRHL